MARIAFIGLGHMGHGMAANLARAGHEVRAFDLSKEALDRAETAGCRPMDSAAEAAEGAAAAVTMLPAGRHVEAVYRDGLFGHIGPDAILIDCSTIDVATARRLAEAARAHGLLAVDAPVSGGIGAANAGTLTFMVGGSDAAFARAEALLGAMGKAVIHAGGHGAGQAAKICNNMILGATMIATCEAFALAEKLGLEAQRFYDIASVSSGQSWSMTSYCPVAGVGPESPSDHAYQGGFAAPLMLKDLKLAMEAAAGVGASTPMGRRAEELYRRFVEEGHAGLDFSGIFRMLQDDSSSG